MDLLEFHKLTNDPDCQLTLQIEKIFDDVLVVLKIGDISHIVLDFLPIIYASLLCSNTMQFRIPVVFTFHNVDVFRDSQQQKYKG